MSSYNHLTLKDRECILLGVTLKDTYQVIALTFLNLKGLPDSILGFFGDNPSTAEQNLSSIIANILIIGILALLAWTIYDLYRGNKRYAAKLAAHQTESDAK